MIKRFGNAIWLGIRSGLILMTIITVMTLPASFMMNKLIYHSSFMRSVVGLITSGLSIFVIIAIFFIVSTGNLFNYFGLCINMILSEAIFNAIIFIAILIMVVTGMWEKPYYFGLWPTYQMKGIATHRGWLALPFKIFSYFIHPIVLFFTESPEDKEGYQRAVAGLLVKRDTTLEYKGQKYAPGAVCEAFGEDTRAVGSISNHTTWSNAIGDLVLTGKAIFGNEEPTTGQQEKTEEIGSLLTQLNQIQTQRQGQGQGPP